MTEKTSGTVEGYDLIDEGVTRPNRGACGCCVFWQLTRKRSEDGYQDEGICRRHPPIAIPSTLIMDDGTDWAGVTGILAAWPRTFGESDWCGEYLVVNDLGGRLLTKEANHGSA